METIPPKEQKNYKVIKEDGLINVYLRTIPEENIIEHFLDKPSDHLHLYINSKDVCSHELKPFFTGLSNNFNLKSLNMARFRIEEAISDVADFISKFEIESLRLIFAGLKCHQVKDITDVLSTNSTLTTLDLADNDIGDEGMSHISTLISTNSTITTLCLSNNFFGDVGIKSLADALEVNSTLTRLSLMGNTMGDSTTEILAKPIASNSTLITLNLSSNEIQCRGISALAASLAENTTLTHLNISDNKFETDGASAIARALTKNSHLVTLNMANNDFEDESTPHFAYALEVNSTLTDLNLSHNNIENGAHLIAESLKINSTLTNLGLVCSDIQEIDILMISEALEVNRTLTFIDINGGYFYFASKLNDINRQCQRNRKLKSMKELNLLDLLLSLPPTDVPKKHFSSGSFLH